MACSLNVRNVDLGPLVIYEASAEVESTLAGDLGPAARPRSLDGGPASGPDGVGAVDCETHRFGS